MPRRRSSAITIAATVAILVSPGSLWSRAGLAHRASSRLAVSQLTPAATAAIRDLLEPGEDLAGISTWADRGGPGPWHYINVPITEARYDAKFCQLKSCVVGKIEDSRQILMDTNAGRQDRQKALKYLVHFLQDLHQPVHVGDNGDRGGNLLQLRWFAQGTNLHQLLDVLVIERHSLDEGQWEGKLKALATEEKSREWSQGSLDDWATESLEAAKLLYRQPGSQDLLRSGTKLGDEYYQFALPIVCLQLARAGVRTAWMLNQIFR